MRRGCNCLSTLCLQRLPCIPRCCAHELPLDAGSVDFLRWKCSIPGKKGTDFEGGQYPITLKFSEEYPSKQPECRLPAGFFHP